MLSLFVRSMSALLLFLTLGLAHASYMNCSNTISGLVSGAVDCEISDATQDSLNTFPMSVNEDGGFFSIDDWSFISKDEGINEAGLGLSGTWALNGNIWSLFDNIMLVFKGGNETTLAGYLLDGQSTSGTWVSPFRSPDFDVRNVKDVSHISFYGTTASAAVPEPSALVLMSLSLAGIGVARRFRKKTG